MGLGAILIATPIITPDAFGSSGLTSIASGVATACLCPLVPLLARWDTGLWSVGSADFQVSEAPFPVAGLPSFPVCALWTALTACIYRGNCLTTVRGHLAGQRALTKPIFFVAIFISLEFRRLSTGISAQADTVVSRYFSWRFNLAR